MGRGGGRRGNMMSPHKIPSFQGISLLSCIFPELSLHSLWFAERGGKRENWFQSKEGEESGN